MISLSLLEVGQQESALFAHHREKAANAQNTVIMSWYESIQALFAGP